MTFCSLFCLDQESKREKIIALFQYSRITIPSLEWEFKKFVRLYERDKRYLNKILFDYAAKTFSEANEKFIEVELLNDDRERINPNLLEITFRINDSDIEKYINNSLSVAAPCLSFLSREDGSNLRFNPIAIYGPINPFYGTRHNGLYRIMAADSRRPFIYQDVTLRVNNKKEALQQIIETQDKLLSWLSKH